MNSEKNEKLTCTRVIRKLVDRDGLGRPFYETKKCGAPAEEYKVGGLTAEATAILCHRHKLDADNQAFVSANGYELGKVADDAYQQIRLPGTGIKS